MDGEHAGLYDPRFEHDACGIGFVADAYGRPGREIVQAALDGLDRVRHRGAVAADHRSGDGAGLLLPIPRGLFAASLKRPELIGAPALGVAMLFMSNLPGAAGDNQRATVRRLVEDACSHEALEVFTWRQVPVELDALGESARSSAPWIEQAILRSAAPASPEEDERRAFRARKRAEASARVAGVALYVASMSFRTVTYKAMCAADQLASFYSDLRDPSLTASFCVFHQRYSTNTAPSWERAQPFRLLCHNGEINTIQGNLNWMRAREGRLGSEGLAPE